jgi:hypothetical protein
MIVGKVKADNLDIKSNYKSDISGVIRLLEVIEHRTTTKNNISSDTKQVISNITNEVPFSLVNNDNRNSFKIQVSQPLNSFYLLENLEVSHSMFEPIKESIGIVNNVVTNSKNEAARVSNEIVRIRGIETIEKMLKNGIQLTAFGKIEKLPSDTNNSWLSKARQVLNYRMSEPSYEYTYIVTPLSKEALLSRLRSNATILKVFLAVS